MVTGRDYDEDSHTTIDTMVLYYDGKIIQYTY